MHIYIFTSTDLLILTTTKCCFHLSIKSCMGSDSDYLISSLSLHTLSRTYSLSSDATLVNGCRECVLENMCTARFWYWLTWSISRLNQHKIRTREHLHQVRSGAESSIVTLIQNYTSPMVCFLVWKMSKYGILCCHSWTVSDLQASYFFL